MLLFREIHEALLYAAASAQGALSAGDRDDGRASVVEALERCGVPVARPIDGPDLDATPAWLLVGGASVEGGVRVAVIPEPALTDELRAALERCDRADLNHETLDDDPELAAALAVVNGESTYAFDVIAPRTGEVRAGSLCRPLSRVVFVWQWT